MFPDYFIHGPLQIVNTCFLHQRFGLGNQIGLFGRQIALLPRIGREVVQPDGLIRTEALVLPAAAIRISPARYRLIVESVLDVRCLSPKEREAGPLTSIRSTRWPSRSMAAASAVTVASVSNSASSSESDSLRLWVSAMRMGL